MSNAIKVADKNSKLATYYKTLLARGDANTYTKVIHQRESSKPVIVKYAPNPFIQALTK